MQIRSVMTSYCLQLRMVKYWINNISGNIEAVFLKLAGLEITVGHRTLSDQILNMSGQFHILIGHDVWTFHQHLLSIHKIWLYNLLKRLEVATGTVANVAKISSLATKILVLSTTENMSAFTGYHKWRLCFSVLTIMVIFSVIMSFQKYIVKDLCFYIIQHKKRKQCVLLLCCKGFPHIGKLANGWSCLKSPYNALQTLEHWVRHVCIGGAGAHHKEPATPILSLCHSIFTDRSIFRLLFPRKKSVPVYMSARQ